VNGVDKFQTQDLCSDIMLNHYLFQKFKLIGKNEFNHLINILTKVICLSVGIPKIDKLEIEGRGFHTNLYAVRGIYSGGKEGKSRIQWLRSMVGSPDLITIPGMLYL
jgi:hypothetical protein